MSELLDRYTTAMRSTQIAMIIQALRQTLDDLIGEAGRGSADYRAYTQSRLSTIRKALRRVSIAVAQEEAVASRVTQASSEIVRLSDGEDLYFHSLLLLDNVCEGAIQELFQIAAMWQEIGLDAFLCGGINGHVIQYQCLCQRRRVTLLALDTMDRQLEAERKQGRLDKEGGIEL